MSDDKQGVDLAATRADEPAEGFPAEALPVEPRERTGGTARCGTRTEPPHRETFKVVCDASGGRGERRGAREMSRGACGAW